MTNAFITWVSELSAFSYHKFHSMMYISFNGEGKNNTHLSAPHILNPENAPRFRKENTYCTQLKPKMNSWQKLCVRGAKDNLIYAYFYFQFRLIWGFAFQSVHIGIVSITGQSKG